MTSADDVATLRWLESGAEQYHNGNYARARHCMALAVIADPANDEGLYGLGTSALRQGDALTASKALRRAFRCSDGNPRYANLLAVALIRAGRAADEAEAALHRALAVKSDFADALANLGLLRLNDGRQQAAGRALRAALCCDPAHPDALNNLGLLHGRSGSGEAASTCFRRCISARPLSLPGGINLGAALQARLQLTQGAYYFRRALVIAPAEAAPLNNLATITQEQGEIGESLKLFDRVVALMPAYLHAAMNRVFSRLYAPEPDPDLLLTEARQVAASMPRDEPRPAGPRPGNCLPRLGFVSSDFRRHAVGHLAIPALEALAELGHPILCYSNSHGADELTERFKKISRWRDIRGLSDRAAVELIRADGVDVLFDLGGYSADNRLPLFALRAAPVQIAWIGYPGTTGLPEMDYLLGDVWQIPEGAERYYSEKPIRLQRSYVVYEAQKGMPDPGPLPALSNGYVTFGSFNGLKKIHAGVLETWAALLRRLETAHLLMKAPALSDPAVRTAISTFLGRLGVSPDRLTLLGHTASEEHQRLMRSADIALDPFPYSGGVTTLDSLWMGVPLVTMAGATFASRHSCGYLSQLGLTDLIGTNREEYLDKLCGLASDLSRLSDLRASLRPLMSGSPLCDKTGFAETLSRILGEIPPIGVPSSI